METLAKEVQCSICLGMPNEPTVTVCGHLFCYVCISRAGDSCPVCRQSVGDPVKLPFLGNIIAIIGQAEKKPEDICTSIGCNNKKSGDAMYCSNHVCLLCNGVRYHGSAYCKDHSCSNCTRQRHVGLSTCTVCTCRREGCMLPGPEGLCTNHACGFCGKGEDHGYFVSFACVWC